MIPIDQLEEMFQDIRGAGRWNMEEPMLWGYFFTDASSEKLQSVVPLLEQAGYRCVNLFEPELDEGVEPYFFLHVEREEVHTVQSLFERSTQLEDFAERHELATYDGMDVGRIQVRQ